MSVEGDLCVDSTMVNHHFSTTIWGIMFGTFPSIEQANLRILVGSPFLEAGGRFSVHLNVLPDA